MATLSAILWVLMVIAAGATVYWAAVLYRIQRGDRSLPTARDGLALSDGEGGSDDDLPAKVSIIVPAHNEQRVIANCARSLLAQDHPRIEVVFVLDRCTDNTRLELERAAVKDPRLVIIENDTCPDDWAGKCNAARVGAEHASGDWLLFTDADTRFDEGLVRAAVALAEERKLDLLSLLSTLTTEHRFERLAQPVASFNLMRMYPLDRVNREHEPRAFANGQFLLFRRASYEQIGGHAAVKDALLEDIAFARRLRDAGGRGGVLHADGMLLCSMYDSFEAFKTGWKRIYLEACSRKVGRLRKNAIRVMLGGAILPTLLVLAFPVGVLGLLLGATLLSAGVLVLASLGLACQLGALRYVYRVCNAPLPWALLYPIGSWYVSRILFDAARDLDERRPISWGGRQYVLEPR